MWARICKANLKSYERKAEDKKIINIEMEP